MPDCPARVNFHGVPRISALLKSMREVFRPRAKLSGTVWPLRFVSSGLGSQVSTWLTPPCMKR